MYIGDHKYALLHIIYGPAYFIGLATGRFVNTHGVPCNHVFSGVDRCRAQQLQYGQLCSISVMM